MALAAQVLVHGVLPGVLHHNVTGVAVQLLIIVVEEPLLVLRSAGSSRDVPLGPV